MMIVFSFHYVSVNINLHSNPMLIIPTNDGKFMDNFREAYMWLRQNTPDTSRIAAWWDYGYQINGIAN